MQPSAAVTGGDHHALVGGHQPEAADNKFPGNNNQHIPGWQTAKLDKTDQRRADQQLIRQRVHKFPKIRHKIILSRNLTVEKVRQAGNDKQRQRHIFGRLAAQIPHLENHVKGNHNHPEYRQLIRQIHRTHHISLLSDHNPQPQLP